MASRVKMIRGPPRAVWKCWRKPKFMTNHATNILDNQSLKNVNSTRALYIIQLCTCGFEVHIGLSYDLVKHSELENAIAWHNALYALPGWWWSPGAACLCQTITARAHSTESIRYKKHPSGSVMCVAYTEVTAEMVRILCPVFMKWSARHVKR